MTAITQPSGLLPGSLVPLYTERPSEAAWIELGFPGLDPKQPTLDLLIFDNSGSVTAPTGTDPIGNRFSEAKQAIRLVAGWTLGAGPKLAVLHFDHPAGASGVLSLRSRLLGASLLRSLHPPSAGSGTSDLLPSLQAAERLAVGYEDHEVRMTVFSDFALTDDDPADALDKLSSFPGRVHAVVLGTEAPDALDATTLTITTLTPDDPPGSFAAALHRSLTASRRGARHSVLHRPKEKARARS